VGQHEPKYQPGKQGASSLYNIYMAESKKVDLVGVGLNATDTLIPLVNFPARGSKVEYRNASIMPGGQAATTVVACQTWGLTTRYVGKLAKTTPRAFIATPSPVSASKRSSPQ
jgi:hypothetical protein